MYSTSIWCVVALFSVVHSQQFVGDLCVLQSTQSQGECKLVNDCPAALAQLQNRQRPQTCGFQGTQPIVCCEPSAPSTTSTRNPGEISIQKCKEYSQFIYVKKKSPVPIIGAPPIIKNECGHKVVTLIVGGQKANDKEFPHQAAIGFDSPDGIKWNCGGTLISEQFVLTAGHCLKNIDLGTANYIRLGVLNLNDVKYRQEFNVIDRIKHPDYSPSSHYNDIGLLKMEKRAALNPRVIPACLYTNPSLTTAKAIATGFGTTRFLGSTSDELRKVTLDFFDMQTCNYSYRNQITRKLSRGIVQTQLCAGALDPDQEKDTCQGDSGGPLQIYHKSDDTKCMYDVIGVTSFGKACSGSPGVYTKVAEYIAWIENTVWAQ